ncbi:MAG TPA: hypothetical protein EYG12_03625, partial [Gammaproteobacteria bacterium]|nr:hypothetical protein [Gammaproteobacteria bacterium]
AVLASYTALNMASRVSSASGRSAVLWLIGGSIAMGVWRQLSCPVRDNYDGRLGGLTFYSFQPA